MSTNGCSHDLNKASPERDKPRERKSIEETVISLRKELHVLYESLKDKNEQLLCLEKDVKDRDCSIKFMKNEFIKLKESLSTAVCSNCLKKLHQQQSQQNQDQNNKTDNSSSDQNNMTQLQNDLKERDDVIKELNKKIIRLSDNLIFVQKESLAKDDRIEDLHREIDKFRQVVRPFTKAIVEQRRDDDFFDEHPGIENTRVILASNEPPRLKRTAISAEPLSQMAGAQNDLVKIPKSSVYVNYKLYSIYIVKFAII
jgi:chromosome segregation ATPase